MMIDDDDDKQAFQVLLGALATVVNSNRENSLEPCSAQIAFLLVLSGVYMGRVSRYKIMNVFIDNKTLVSMVIRSVT